MQIPPRFPRATPEAGDEPPELPDQLLAGLPAPLRGRPKHRCWGNCLSTRCSSRPRREPVDPLKQSLIVRSTNVWAVWWMYGILLPRVMGQFAPWEGGGATGRSAERTPDPAPTEPERRISFASVRPRAGRGHWRSSHPTRPRAERTRARAPTEPERRLPIAFVRLRAGTGLGRRPLDRPRSACQRASSIIGGARPPRPLNRRRGAEPPHRPGAGSPGVEPTLRDVRGSGRRDPLQWRPRRMGRHASCRGSAEASEDGGS